jgi:hypothetical protein
MTSKAPTSTNSLVNWLAISLQMSAVPKGVWTNRLTSFSLKLHEWKKIKKNCEARNAMVRRTRIEGKMTGPRPAGRPWTLTDDDMLRKLKASGMNRRLIAQKMKRSIGAISRIHLFKKPRKRQESARRVKVKI